MTVLDLLADLFLGKLAHRAGTSPSTRQTTFRSCLAFAAVGAIAGLISIPLMRKPLIHDPSLWLITIAVCSAAFGLVGILLARRRTDLGRPVVARAFVCGALFAFTLLALRFVYDTSGG